MAEDKLVRISISIEKSLVDRIDGLIHESGAANRSEAVRDLIRARLLEHDAAQSDGDGVATVTLVYDHNTRKLSDKLIDVGHEHHHEILASMHVHLDDDRCLEVVAMRGRRSLMRRVADGMIGMKGVEHGRLVMAAVRKGRAARKAGAHSHGHSHPHDHSH